MWGLLHTTGTLVKKMVLCGRWLKDKRWGNGKSSATTWLCRMKQRFFAVTATGLGLSVWHFSVLQRQSVLWLFTNFIWLPDLSREIFLWNRNEVSACCWSLGVTRRVYACVEAHLTSFVWLNVFALSNGWVQVCAERGWLQGRTWTGTQVSVQAAQTYCHYWNNMFALADCMCTF